MPYMQYQQILEALLDDLSGSRVTLRQDVEGDVFPITHEALDATTQSIIGLAAPNMAGQPVVVRVLAGKQVIQNDCKNEFINDAPFQEMLVIYGGMGAQIVTPIVIEGETKAIISLHVLGETREWTAADAERCQAAVDAVHATMAGGPAAHDHTS